MILETKIVIYVCSICQRTYKLKEDARKCESLCAKLLKSPDISVLGLSSRTYNLLKIAGIDTLDELLETSDYQLLRIKRFGKGALNELHEKIQMFKAKSDSKN
ncbi:DNA-directed RNA polymerase subunit alpha C-terminal domain-containing protein [Desulfosporosinus orientis]|uniref:DNA-directed RNA polymerase subunit alpha C-terminal domain-containing protein n=1 Tax=Desulfosporosinus orientis TaxID=1563 RepID=UPI000319BBD9|nr:DNA-directed RNA polymerase subunit alpha C-terminal domain-containing protein [Desulfosporosinus orientis]